jgi:diguanylate cyclase (GGDEF)-like protein
VSANVQDAAVASSVKADQSLLRSFVQANMTLADIPMATQDPRRAETLEAELRALVAPGEVLRLKLWARDGTILLSDVPALRGQRLEVDADLLGAFEGHVVTDVTAGAAGEERGALPLAAEAVISEYLPVVMGGQVTAVFEVYRDAAPIMAGVDATRRDVLMITLAAMAFLAVVLRLIFKATSDRLRRQADALVEATRRDALTGLLNHGAVVAVLEERVEQVRASRGSLALALVDIDNFRLLNDAHGHAAGDRGLREVAALLEEELPAGAVIGRFGPDEFLAVSPLDRTADLESAVERVRNRLTAVSLHFGSSEQLPLTVGVGLAVFPLHGASATDLLAAVTQALASAKASGGNGIRVAPGPQAERESAETRNFDILKGLVIAVDTKDRYTARHSEDVARYAGFLAEQLGLAADERRTLRIAALLHDVGKIGVPDAILRKPDRLTEDEYDAVKQHVALGHLIVRDMAHLGDVRAGIRHHHERWDGRGYLDGLSGTEIPLVARILAVADAFSAMTTSRPYRKALPVEEALRRLTDAADSQLDPHLAVTFVQAMETAQNAPLPGLVQPARQVWSLQEALA